MDTNTDVNRDYANAMRKAERITDPDERARAEEAAGFAWFCDNNPGRDI